MSLAAAQECMVWALQNGSSITNVKIEALEGRGNSLLFHRTNHSGTSARIFIPSDILLTLKNIEKFSDQNKAFKEVLKEWSTRVPITSRRAIMLLMAFSKRHGSPWSNYLLSLPTQIDSPVFWSSTDRRLLAGTSIDGVAEDKISFVQAWLTYQQTRSDASAFTASLTLEEFLLYEMLVDSRALLSNESDSCMVPVIDFANHTSTLGINSGGQNSAWNMTRDGFELSTFGEIPDGTEILFSYGKRGNGELLVKYGFIEEWQVTKGSRSITLELDLLEDGLEYGEPSFRLGTEPDDDNAIFENSDCAYLWLLVIQGEPEVDHYKHNIQGRSFTKETLRGVLLEMPLWPFYCYKACQIAEHYIVRNMQQLQSSELDPELGEIAMALSRHCPERLRLIDGVRDAEMQTYILQRDRLHKLSRLLESDTVVQAELRTRSVSYRLAKETFEPMSEHEIEFDSESILHF